MEQGSYNRRIKQPLGFHFLPDFVTSYARLHNKDTRQSGHIPQRQLHHLHYCGSGMVSRIPPMTSCGLKSFLGLLGCALWQLIQDWDAALSA